MKVLAVILVCFSYVAARRSGPYLPSGWKPDGPAFFLPSEVSKPVEKPVEEVVFQESEASGSDFLREYGPPKVQEVSQELSQQGLPDAVNEQLFDEAVVKTIVNQEISDAVAEVNEQKTEEVISEVTSPESQAVVEDVTSAAVIESVSNVHVEGTDVNSESATVTNLDTVQEIAFQVETTATTLEVAEEVNNEATSVPSITQVVEESIVDAQQVASNQQESEQLVSQIVDESTVAEANKVSSGHEESTSVVQEQQTVVSRDESSGATVSEEAEGKIEIVKEIQSVEEEVKKVEEVVQNIPTLIINLENEVKTQQAEIIQEIPAVVQETLGPLEQAPEGFLEYGPPGFTEYGPPKDALGDNTIEENLDEQSVRSNEARKRRFSPKFRPSKKNH